jgi:hypothetical protein
MTLQLSASPASLGDTSSMYLSGLECTLQATGALAALLQSGSAVTVEQRSPSSLTLRFAATASAAAAHHHTYWPLPVDLNRTRVAVGRRSLTVVLRTAHLQLPEGGVAWTKHTRAMSSNPFPMRLLRAAGSPAGEFALHHWCTPSLPLPLLSCPLLHSVSHSLWLCSAAGAMLGIPAERAYSQSDIVDVPALPSMKQTLHAMVLHFTGCSSAEGDSVSTRADPKAKRPAYKVFGLNCAGFGGIHAIVVLHGIRLATSLDTLVLDCSVCALEAAFTQKIAMIVQSTTGEAQLISLSVNAGELTLWQHYLPSPSSSHPTAPTRSGASAGSAGTRARARSSRSCWRGARGSTATAHSVGTCPQR